MITRPLFILLTLTLLYSHKMEAQQRLIYSQIELKTDLSEIEHLFELGLDVDHPEITETGIRFFVTQIELQLLKDLRYDFQVVITDYTQHFNQLQKTDLKKIIQTKKKAQTANYFGYGSMGGFYTRDEVIEKLDSMTLLFPSIASAKFSIGTSVEGRDIWALKISDNPSTDEPEPAVYYDALHHCREPLSMSVTINYMYWLLENYAIDQQVKYIVDNRELYFVPIVNPDGYVYNEQTNPNGGGLWRKNRRDNGTGCFGVDLNRNYGFAFGNNSSCASSNSCSNTFKGPNAFSEPETQATKNFIDSIQPTVAFSTHSTAGKYLMPYGYNTSPPQYGIYSEWASDFLDENDYIYGVTYEMLGYTSCGTTRDYMHSEGIYGWTPEIRGSGFWPLQSEIFALVDENIKPMFYQAWIAGGYADLQSHSIIGSAYPGGQFQMEISIRNKGVGDSIYNTTVQLVPLDANISVSTPILNYGNIAPRAISNGSASFSIQVAPQFSLDSIKIQVAVFQDGVESNSEVITAYIGNKTSLFFDDAENGLSNWVSTGNGKPWGIVSDDMYSGSNSFGDSDNGNTSNNTTNWLSLQNSISIPAIGALKLSYMAKWSIENTFDYARIQISTNNGSLWTTLKDYAAASSWVQETIDLSAYLGFSNLLFRFEMDTDQGEIGDGFYFDDFELAVYDPVPSSFRSALESLSINIFPNPTRDVLNIISSGKLFNTQISIYDSKGQEVFRLNNVTLKRNSEIDISSFAEGAYTLKIGEVTRRFTVVE